ncbi:glycoside hydrolase family 3 N-terminal domain-containing protein [Georgenia halophila]|uniref:Glycoside hydrolase family 3 N-terminal domain-containing protein n=1 Tax=Georgenia halophila TaxID=620889 RepID=A0ABP8LG77_9MICO
MTENSVATSAAPASGAWKDRHLPVHERVEAVVAEMTLEEKAGQLGSFWAQDPLSGGEVAPMQSAMAAAAVSFPDAIRDGLGQLTRVYGSGPLRVPDGVPALRDMQRRIAEASRFGIAAVVHEECLAGLTALGATCFPVPLSWGATFEPELVAKMGAAIGADMRAVGVHQGLAPVLDVVRDYRWGRVEETIGEDPYLVGTVATAYVQGMQSSGVIATLKHFAGYSASRAGRNHAPVPMGRRELDDVILPPFEMAVREGRAGSVMNSYADIDGEAPAASRRLLTDLLRDTWGFGGTVVSDYWSVNFLELVHRVAADLPDAARLAISAGLDVELPLTGGFRHLPALVRAGKLDEEVLDTAVRRVLTQKVALGLLDGAWETDGDESHDDLDSPDNRALAAEIAEKSVVLLDNDGILPLDTGGQHVAVVGPSAVEERTFLGCYAFPNHIMARMGAAENGIEIPSLLESLRDEWPDANVEHELGCPILEEDTSGIPAAVELARRSDVAVVTVGDLASLFGRGTSGEGCDAEDLTLPGSQAELVDAVLATGTPVVLVVVSGRPYALGDYADRCRAVVQTFFPGEEGGAAIAGVLSGRVNPSGRLPVGVPRNAGGQPSTYLAPPLGQRSDGISNLDPTPLYPFGHGLSYSAVEYGDLALSTTEIATDGTVEASLTVANTGERTTDEVVQLYLSDHVAQVTRPVHELIGYRRVTLEPGQCRRVTFSVHAERTSFTGVDHTRIVEPGSFTLSAGRSVGDLRTTADLAVTGSVREIVGARVMTTPVVVEEIT